MKDGLKPTPRQYAAFQAAFDYFNGELFAGTLPHVVLTFSRASRTLGFFVNGIWFGKKTDGNKEMRCEIALNPDYIGQRYYKDTMATLVHEMCHLWQEVDGTAPRRCYHNKDFSKKMESVGLITSNTGKEGGKRTGQNMTQYIQAGGRFEKAYEKMPDACKIPYITIASLAGPAKKKIKRNKSNRVKYVCPVCGAAAWGKEGLHMICGDCMEAMEPIEK